MAAVRAEVEATLDEAPTLWAGAADRLIARDEIDDAEPADRKADVAPLVEPAAIGSAVAQRRGHPFQPLVIRGIVRANDAGDAAHQAGSSGS